jgi:hypothetical protein
MKSPKLDQLAKEWRHGGRHLPSLIVEVSIGAVGAAL